MVCKPTYTCISAPCIFIAKHTWNGNESPYRKISLQYINDKILLYSDAITAAIRLPAGSFVLSRTEAGVVRKCVNVWHKTSLQMPHRDRLQRSLAFDSFGSSRQINQTGMQKQRGPLLFER